MKTNRPIGCGPALNAAGPLNFALAPPTDMRTNVAAKLTTGRDGKANSALELDLFGYIWDYPDYINTATVKAAIDAAGYSFTSVHLNIQSPGGDVYEAMGVYDLLNRLGVPIHVNILGFAGSCASWLAMLGDTITMPEFSEIMIHRVQGGIWGNATEIVNAGRAIENLEENIIQIYVARTKQSADDIRKWMADETYMDGNTALERGFCTEVTKVKAVNLQARPETLAALGFKHYPSMVNKANSAGADPKPFSMADMEELKKNLSAIRGHNAYLASRAAAAGMLPQ